MSLESAELIDLGIENKAMEELFVQQKSGIGNPARHICMCGHALSRHTKTESGGFCTVSKAWCDCSGPLAVLEPSDLRPFRFSTTGIGEKHALTKGLYKLRREGNEAKWLIDLKCFKCGATETTLLPTALTRDRRISLGSGHSNAFLCNPCIDSLGGYPHFY
jgi:hypothetical protein